REFDAERVGFWMILWGLVGAKLGFLFFYTLPFTRTLDPALFWPYREGVGQGIRGMSVFGGLVGAVGYLRYVTRAQRERFWQVLDTIVLYAPLGIFLGRLGN